MARSPAAETDGAQVSELWASILSPANLNEAWRRVRANGGAAGIDRMTVASFPRFFRAHGPAVLAKLWIAYHYPSQLPPTADASAALAAQR